jgi:hypothetical protein
MADPQDQTATQDSGPWTKYQAAAPTPSTGESGPWDKYATKGYQGPVTSTGIAAPQGTESVATAGVKGAKDVLTGMAEGAANTVGNAVSGTARLINKIPGVGEYLAPKQGIEALEAKTKERSTPENTAQTIGRTGEQIGEWMLPSGAEEKAATLLGKIPYAAKAIPAAKIGVQALESGLRNKSQGGDFTTGAEAGAGGEVLSQGLQKVAPIVAETALGVTNKMRGHGRDIGGAALNELSSVRPSSLVGESGQKIRALTTDLESRAAQSATPATTAPALQVVDNAIATYQKRNSPMVGKLQGLRDQLTTNAATGKAIPSSLPASDVLELKRGVGDLINSWNPTESRSVKPIIQRVYGALDNEVDRTVPGAQQLNQRISSLIPVKQRASILANGAPTAQRIAARIARPTGALLGAGVGYHEYGVPGAVAGLAIPEMLSSPTGQMFAARALKSGAIPQLGKAAALQLDRDKEPDESKARKAIPQ